MGRGKHFSKSQSPGLPFLGVGAGILNDLTEVFTKAVLARGGKLESPTGQD